MMFMIIHKASVEKSHQPSGLGWFSVVCVFFMLFELSGERFTSPPTLL